MKKIIFYQSNFSQIGGVETFAYNWCWWLRNYFDVTVLYCTGFHDRLRKMARLVKVEHYEENKIYECDIFIRNSVWGTIPENIKAKRMIEIRHANYKFLQDKGKLKYQYHPMGIKEIVGCGEFVSKMSNLVLGDNPTTIKNILLPKKKTQKVLRLISCTRIDPEKGWNRMLKLCDMLREAKIKFTWDIFTNSVGYQTDYEEIKFWQQRDDIFDYVANADYTVLLSDSEGLPYTVQESLQYQTPCIVTDVGGCTELIQDGVNGYVVPLDMKFDINKIKKIPQCKEYNNNALKGWLDYLGYKGNIIEEKKLIEKFEEERKMKVKVKCIKNYYDTKQKDKEGKDKLITTNDEPFVVELERAEQLVDAGVCEIVQKPVEVVKDIKEKAEEVTEKVKEEVKKVKRAVKKK